MIGISTNYLQAAKQPSSQAAKQPSSPFWLAGMSADNIPGWEIALKISHSDNLSAANIDSWQTTCHKGFIYSNVQK